MAGDLTRDAMRNAAASYSRRARARRDEAFRRLFSIGPETRILDLGSYNGDHIAQVLTGVPADPANVYIADIDADAVEAGSRKYGFTPVVLDESGHLPFPDGYFDIVHCSSVLEHVTIPKSEVWDVRSGRDFKAASYQAQAAFAREIIRVGRQYYVQTPDRWFPVESHSWLPFVGFIPRRLQIPVLRYTNTFWIKKTSPDWNLLDARSLSLLFEGRPVLRERSLGLVKSVTAWKTAADSDSHT